MIRKSLFWGLTLVLVAALVSLIIRGRRLEKQQAEISMEVIEQSQASPIRVLQPDDLRIESSTMQREGAHTALHEIQIRNTGTVPYGGIHLAFVYLDSSGKVLFTRTHPLGSAKILPGQTYAAPGIRVEEVPAAATKFQISILSADMLSQEVAGQKTGS